MKRFVLHIIVIYTLIGNLSAQTDTAFWFAIPRMTPNHPASGVYHPGGKPVYLVFAALGPTTVTISMPANPSFTPITYTFTAAGSARIDMSSYINTTNPAASIENAPENTVLNKGLYIRSDRNFITAYYEVDNYYNRDIFSLKGANALGTEFIVPFQRDTWNPSDGNNGTYNTPYPDGTYTMSPYSTIDIVATENNTQITITPSVNVLGHPAGVPFTITLNRGQTYSIRSIDKSTANHMGGTKIVANKKIAITIKDDSVKKSGSYDLQGDQNIPKNIAGKNYIVMRGRISRKDCNHNSALITEGNPSGEQVYIYGTAAGTKVTINDTLRGTIGEGQRLNWNISNNATFISADKPVYVYHVSGIGCETGAAVLPTIDGCTGSKLVPIVRSTDEPFYLNIMTTTKGKKYIFISYTDASNNPVTYAVPETNFEPAGTSGWWVLKSDKKSFDTTIIPVNKIVTVYTTAQGDRFHLGIMNGGNNTGCKYGYFSDYASSRGSASVLTTGSEVYEACYGEPIQIVASGGLSYAWWLSFSSLGDTTINYLSDTTVANPIATPPTGVYIYKVKITRACYPDTVMQVAVNVLPQVVALFRTDTSQLCSRANGNNTITFYNISPNPDTLEFYWDFNGDNVPELTNIRNTNPITWTFPRNTGTHPVTYKVTLFAFLRNNSSCLSTFSKNITIYPEIDANFTSTTTTGCNPLYVSFTNTTTGDTAGVSYLWDFGDGSATAQKSPGHLFQNLIQPADTTYQVKLIATSRYYCRDTATTTVTVRPFIKASFTVDTTRGCADFTIKITNSSRGAISSYNWNFGDGQTSTTSAPSFTKTYSNNTSTKVNRNLQLIVSNAAGCTDTLIRTITVLPKVFASYTASAVDGCNPLTVTFTPGSNNANVTYLWEFGDNNSSSLQSPTHTFENNTNTIKTYTTKLTVTSEDFCVATFSNNITVREKIEANFSIDKVRGCSGFYSNIQNLSFGGNAIVNYTWNFGDGSPLWIRTPANQPNTFNHQYINNGNNPVTYNLQLTVNNSFGCTSTKTVPITVNPGVAASFTTSTTQGCNPLSVTFTNTTDMNKASSIKWEFDDNTSSTDPVVTHVYSHLEPNTKVYNARLIAVSANTGCIDTTVAPITVYSYIHADMAVDTSIGCSPLPVNINNLSAGGISQYNWNFGDGATSNSSASSLSHTYVNKTNNPTPQVRTLKLVVSNAQGCKDSTQLNITVKPEALAQFAVSRTDSCTPFNVRFTNQSNSISTSYFWDFDDGSNSVDTHPVHTFTNTSASDRTYNVKLRATTAQGCTDDTIVPVTAFAYIQAGFSVDDALICSHTPVHISNIAQGGIAQVKWDMDGNGSTEYTNNASTFTYPFINNTNSDLNLLIKQVVKNNHACYDSTTTWITVKPRVLASFTVDKDEGCNPVSVVFTNTSNIKDNVGTTFLWDFADGSYHTGKDATHTFYNFSAKDSVYPVKLTVTSDYQCADDTTVNITAFPEVNANFSLSVPSACSYENFIVTNNSSPGVSHSYWDFTGTGSQNLEINSASFQRFLVNTDTVPKTYQIRLVAKNNHACYDTMYRNIDIMPIVISNFSMDVDSGCQPLQVNFTNLANIRNTAGTQFRWQFGDGAEYHGRDTAHTYINLTANDISYPVTLTTTSNYNCSHDTTKYVNVYAFIDAQISLPSSLACSNTPFVFNNNSSPGVKHSYWLFGDGSTEVENNATSVTHTYVLHDTVMYPKNFTIRLIGTNNHAACRDTDYVSINVNPIPKANFAADVSEGCEPVRVQFTNQTVLPNCTYFWNFADGNSSSDTHPLHYFYNASGNDTVYQVMLKAVSNMGCRDSIVKPITAYARIAANFSVEDAAICAPGYATFVNNYIPGVKYNYWDFNGDNINDTLINAKTFTWLFQNTTLSPETLNVKLTVKNNHECYKSTQQQIVVYPKVVASFTADKWEGCQPLTVQFTNQSNIKDIAGTQFFWFFGNGATSSQKNPSYTYTHLQPNDVTYNVKLVTRSAYNCQDDTVIPIKPYAYVKAGFTLPKTTFCPDYEVANILNGAQGEVDQCTWKIYEGNTPILTFNNKNTNINVGFTNNTLDTAIRQIRQYVYNKHQCMDTAVTTVMVFPHIEPFITADQTEGCQPLRVKFTNQTNIKNIPGSIFEWQFGDGNSSYNKDTVTNLYVNAESTDKTFTATLKVTSREGCVANTSMLISTYAYIKANFATPNDELCSGESIPIQDNSLGGIANKYWDFTSDGIYDHTGTLNSISYENLTDNTVTRRLKLKVINAQGCADSTTREIEVHPKVIANFTRDTVGCTPFNPNFSNTSSKSATLFEWTFGDGGSSPEKNPSKTYINNTENDIVYNVKLVAMSEHRCRDSIVKTVKVAHRPIARISVDKIIGCPPLEVNLYNTTKTSGSTYNWDFGDGGTLEVNDKRSITRTYYNEPTRSTNKPYVIKLRAVTPYGCDDTTSVTINVYPKVTAKFDTTFPDCNPIQTTIINRSMNATDFWWDFGDNTTSNQRNPTHLFNNETGSDKLFTVKLKAWSEYGCYDSTTRKVLVYPGPDANFLVNPIVQFFPNATFKITNRTNKGPWMYLWDFGNGDTLLTSSSDTFSYTYPHWGRYTIRLKVYSNKCSDTTSLNVVLYAPRPIADFDSAAEGCAPLTIRFRNQSIYGERYYWEFDDGSVSEVTHPVHTFVDPGEYNVKLTVYAEGGTDVHYEQVKVYPRPIVDFNVEPQLVMIPDDQIQCFNNTQYGDKYIWYFGDGNTSEETNPSHYYKELGVYTIKLVAISPFGCSDSLERVNIVQVMGKGKIEFPNAFTPSMSGPKGGRYDPHATDNDIFFPYHEGVAQYHLEIYDRWGELLFVSDDVNIGWDGYYKGKLCKQGVYVYKARGKFYNGRTFVKAGDITLIHK